jgi:hypothetical protein
MGHAFDALGCIAVEFRTHFFNQQSRRAIERLGAKLDGVLCCHQRAKDGSLRDTCVLQCHRVRVARGAIGLAVAVGKTTLGIAANIPPWFSVANRLHDRACAIPQFTAENPSFSCAPSGSGC